MQRVLGGVATLTVKTYQDGTERYTQVMKGVVSGATPARAVSCLRYQDSLLHGALSNAAIKRYDNSVVRHQIERHRNRQLDYPYCRGRLSE